MSLTCPNCHHIIAIKVVSKAPNPSRRPAQDISPLSDKVLADVFEFMREVAPLTAGSSGLYQQYLAWTKLPRPLSMTSFGVALQRNGATRWRTSQARGYTIGTIDPEAQPATMTPQQRQRFEAAHQRQAVEQHRGGGGQVPTGLPLTVG